MKAPKIIFTDIDGTIREASGHIPKSTVRAIHELQQAGYLVVVSTGRPECEIPDRVYEIGFDGYISACGAQVRFHDEIVLDQVIPEDLFRGIVSYMEDHEIVGYFQCPKKNFVWHRRRNSTSPTMRDRMHFFRKARNASIRSLHSLRQQKM